MDFKKMSLYLKKHPILCVLMFLLLINGLVLIGKAGSISALFNEYFELWMQFLSGFMVPISILAITYSDDEIENSEKMMKINSSQDNTNTKAK